MTGEKKAPDLSARLGVKRSKNPVSKFSKSPSTSISSPPKAAIATSKTKKGEIQRHKNPFNDMQHSESGKEKGSGSTISSNLEEEEDAVRFAENVTNRSATERVAELERALAVAREEQNILREELAKMREHSLVYQETIEDYRRQLAGTYSAQNPHGAYHGSPRRAVSGLSTISMDFEVEDEPHRSLHSQSEDHGESAYELRGKLAQLQDQLVSQESLWQTRIEQARSHSQREWNEMTSRLHATEKESQERLQQLLSLKSSISSLTRMDPQVTDSELSEALSQLANRVREWVISNFRRTKLELANLPPGTVKALEAISSDYRTIDPTDRLALYQGLICSTMMFIFHEPIIIGVPETGPLAQIRQLAACIRDTGTEFREWRRRTIRCLEKSDSQPLLQQEKERLVHRLSSEVGYQLFTLTSVNLSQSAQSSLVGILHAAAELQRTLIFQKAQYIVHFFSNQQGRQTLFDDDRMESVNDLDGEFDEGDVMTERTFAFCVSPGLEKIGDEYGENTEVRNVLLKARVCCGVG